MSTDTTATDDAVRTQVLDSLSHVWDPELGLDIVSLGLVYDVRVEDRCVTIDMTLTTPGCPVSESLPQEAESAARGGLQGYDVAVNIVWDPPWTPERLSPAAMDALGFRR